MPIELWEIKQFKEGIIVINPLKKSDAAPNIKQVQSKEDSKISKIIKEVKVYNEDYHLENKSEEQIELYESFKCAILNLSSDIEIIPKKLYIAFKRNKNIADIHLLNKGFKIWINLKKGELDDPKKLALDVSNIGHWGNGDYQISVYDTSSLEYIMSLIKQAI